MYTYFLGSFCPLCDTKVESGNHDCLVFINGYPTTGNNHGKLAFEIPELFGKTKTVPRYDMIPSNLVMSYFPRK